MNLSLLRTQKSALSTIGELSLDGTFYCYTLERPEVQIPEGAYSLEITFSPRFQRLLPLLEGTSPRTDIRIHAGNWPRDTEGCILVGLQKGQNSIFASQLALGPLVTKLQEALDSGDVVQLTIS